MEQSVRLNIGFSHHSKPVEIERKCFYCYGNVKFRKGDDTCLGFNTFYSTVKFLIEVPLNPLTTDDECTRHATLAACRVS